MKINSLSPQIVLQSSSRRESSHESSRESNRDRGGRDSDQPSSEPGRREKQKSEQDSSSKRDDDFSLRTPLRLASVTMADLSAALSPESLGLLNFTDSLPCQNKLNTIKKSSESDPVADVLQRLALLAEADRRKRSLALAAYAKVRDALKPEVLPDVVLVPLLSGELSESQSSVLSDESDTLSGALDGAIELNEIDHLNELESFGFDSPESHLVASRPNGPTARAAFTHIDLAA